MLEDISYYLHDLILQHDQKGAKKKKEQEDKLQGEWMRYIAMEGINSKQLAVQLILMKLPIRC